MKHLEAGGYGHVDPAPDGGFDVVQDDMQAGDGLGAHAASLAGSGDQFHGMSSSHRLTGQSPATLAMTSVI